MNAMLKPVELVDVENGQPMTTTLQIALGLGLMHKSVIQMVRTYLPDFQEFGRVRFETANSAFEMANLERVSTQGRHTRYAVLNEQQATFLMTLMRNSPRVIEFKKALVQAFFHARSLLQTDYFALVQQHSSLTAVMDLEKGFASHCGKGLNDWKRKRDCLQAAIANIERQLQPCLNFDETR